MEVFANSIHVVDVGCERNVCGENARGGLTTPPLIVVNQVIGIRQTIQLWQQIKMVKVRATMKNEHVAASTDVS